MMRKWRWFTIGVFFSLGLPLAAYAADMSTAEKLLDTEGIAKAFRKPGEMIGYGAYKVSFPRSDLHILVGKLVIKPGFALVNWAAFKKSGEKAMTYGDLVLLDGEVNPVITKLEEKGIEVSALHNHLIHENPRVLYIHFMGEGDEVQMANGLREALELTGTPLKSIPSVPEEKPETAKEIERIIGLAGNMGGGVLHINVPRNDIQVKWNGMEMPGNMGMNIPLNFQMDGSKAAINGDFMLLSGEINPVIKALRANGIEIASLHNHMLDEEPRLFFMHFWAYDDAIKLAKGLKFALQVLKK